jgi:putative transposase
MRHTTFRFVLDPTPAQEQLLARYAGASRSAYNQCLTFVTDGLAARRMDPLVRVPWSGYDLINEFNAWKRGEDAGRLFVVARDGTISKQVTGLAWRHRVSAQVFEEAAVDLGRALAAYWRTRNGTCAGRTAGFPRRKRKGRCRDGFRLRNKLNRGGYSIRVGEGHPRSVTLPTIGRVRVHDDTRRLRRLLRPRSFVDPVTGEQQRAPRAKILFATVVRRGSRWYVALNIHAPDLHPERCHRPRSGPGVGRFVGVDLGLAAFAVAARSDRTEVGRWAGNNPLTCRLRRLRRYSRAVSRARRGSRNRGKAVRRLGREHARIADARLGFLHEVSSHLVKAHAQLAIENLAVTISSTTTASPAPSGMPHGQSSPGSSPTRPNGSARSWWFATAGSHRARPARGAARAKSGWSWQSGSLPAIAVSSSWTGTATLRPTSRPGPSVPRPRTAKRAAGSPMPLEGKALAVAVATVEPALMKEEPELRHALEPRTPEKGGVPAPHEE